MGQLHEFSLPGSSVPSRLPTLFSPLVFRTSARGASPVRVTKPIQPFTKLSPLVPAGRSERTVNAPVVTTAQEGPGSPKKEVSQPLCLSAPSHTTTTTPERDTEE